MLSFDIVKDQQEIEKYYAVWDALFAANSYQASASVDWTHALLRTHVGSDRCILIVLRNAGDIVGLVPLAITTTKKYGIALTTAFPVAHYYCPHNDLLLKDPSEEAAAALMQALNSSGLRWDVLRFRRFTEDNPAIASLERYLRTSPYTYESSTGSPSFFIRLDGSYNDYLMKKSGNFRYNLKRKEKKLNALGDVAYLTRSDFGTIDDAYNAVLHIEENSWKHKHGTAITSVDRQRVFYKELCERAEAKGWLRLRFFTLNKEPVAYNMGLIKNGAYYLLKLSYHDRFRQMSPGTLLIARLVEELTREGIKEFDFAGEPYEYEKQWTDDYREHRSIVVYNNTVRAKAFSLYHSLKNRLTKESGEGISYRDPRANKPKKPDNDTPPATDNGAEGTAD